MSRTRKEENFPVRVQGKKGDDFFVEQEAPLFPMTFVLFSVTVNCLRSLLI